MDGIINMVSMGIIGTCGRGDDHLRLDRELYDRMKDTSIELVRKLRGSNLVTLVSGGAAISDHIVVRLYLDGFCDELVLHLPALFDLDTALFENNKTGQIANYYHQRTSQKLYYDKTFSLRQIKWALENGAQADVSAGFFARNELVALGSDYLIAFTFGEGAKLKDGGTSHTMDVFLRNKNPNNSYHVNLNDLKIYNPARVK